ncbi:MAG: amidase family protein [Paracoccaceae bacterium]|nr:amidase family protein [Paracoccaceae bacterium]
MSERWRDANAAELGRGIGAGRIDPRELTDVFLDAIDAHPDADRIYARLTPKRARVEAAEAADRAKSGARLGPLDGVPISWKDNYDIAGEVTEAGSMLLKGKVADKDAACFTAARAAGLVCLGKTHLSELAFSGLGVNPKTATPPNAFEPARAPGGSSSGAAVSVALGLAAAGIGSDTGGSVRIPAAWNGLAGLKTTAGVIPCDGVVPLSTTYDTVGPLCHTVEDCGLFFSVLAQRPQEVPAAADLSKVKFLVPETVVLDGCDPEPLAAFEAAVDALGSAGAKINRGPVPELAEAIDVTVTVSPVVNSEAWRIWGETIEVNPGVMFEFIEKRFRSGMGADPKKDARALAELDKLSKRIQRRMSEQGVILMPSSPCLPPPVDRLLSEESFYAERNLLALRNTRLGNLLVLSALTVPVAAPMCGLMLVGGSGQEDLLLALGRAVEPVVRAG